MSFDGLFLHKMCLELLILKNARIQKIINPSNYEFVFSLRQAGQSNDLLISVHPNDYRIQLTKNAYKQQGTPTHFLSILRKYIEGGILASITPVNGDRVLHMKIRSRNEIGDNITLDLYVELLGKLSNIVIVNEDNTTIDSYKKTNFLGERIIFPKTQYTLPSNEKSNFWSHSDSEVEAIFQNKFFTRKEDIMSCFSGFGPLYSEYIINGNQIERTRELMAPEFKGFWLRNGKKEHFYFHDIGMEVVNVYPTLSLLLDAFFIEKTKRLSLGEKGNNALINLKKIYQKAIHKLDNLETDLSVAKSKSIYQKYGELLFANLEVMRRETLVLFDYESNSDVSVAIDTNLSLKDNAIKCFSIYKKSKSAIHHIGEQIIKTEDELAYLRLLIMQIEFASPNEIDEIIDEISAAGYSRQQKSGKKKPCSQVCFLSHDNYTIYYGKNNHQNERITHSIANPNDYFFHVKDAPGSHVILKTVKLTEEAIRLSSMIAAYFSPLRDSSSIPVDYTEKRNVKKIPGKRNCFVTYKNQKTIYIDVDKELLTQLKIA